MANKAVMDAVEARLDSGWSRAPRLDLNADMATPPATAEESFPPFVVVEYPYSDERQVTLGGPGTSAFRETGAFRIVLSVPAGAGREPYATWIEELRGLFRGARFGGVLCQAPSGSTTDDRGGPGAYWRMSFAVPYEFDFIPPAPEDTP